MDTEFKVIAIIVIVLLGLMAVFLIIALKSLNKLLHETAEAITRMTVDLTKSVNKVTEDINDLKDRLTQSLTSIDSATQQRTATSKTIDNGFQRAFDVIEPVEQLVSNVYERVAPPLNYLSLIVSGGSKAAVAFINAFANRKRK